MALIFKIQIVFKFVINDLIDSKSALIRIMA